MVAIVWEDIRAPLDLYQSCLKQAFYGRMMASSLWDRNKIIDKRANAMFRRYVLNLLMIRDFARIANVPSGHVSQSSIREYHWTYQRLIAP